MSKTFTKIIGYGLVLLLIVASVGFTYKYTNGFNEDFKTFYVEYGGKQILTADSKLTLESDAIHIFNVKYTFDNEKTEPKDYKVKIVPNITRDFDFTVDGEKYIFSRVGDLTAVFEPIKHGTFFELYLPETLSFSEVLKRAYNGKIVSVASDAFANNPYPYRLQVSSYNDKVIYNIDFTFGDSGSSDSEQSSGGDTNKPTTPNTPSTPTEPEMRSYKLSWGVVGNDDNLVSVDVYCPDKAVAGERVNFSVSLLSDYECSVKMVEVFSGGKHYAYAQKSDYNSYTSADVTAYSFTMPEADAEIVVTIEKVETKDYYSISYDTLGSGSCDSVIVYCAEAAKPGDYVMVSVCLAWDVVDLEIVRVVLTNADTGDEILEMEQLNEFFDFTMPDCDVVIMIYLMPI